jgi:GNAT superfamily N-acetyltransferase
MSSDTSAVFLREVSTNNPVPAELWDGILPKHLADWTQHWQPALKRTLQTLPVERWPENWHWDWDRKVSHVSGLLGARTFCVVAQAMTQGLMSVDLTKNARIASQRSKPLVYIDYLEVAPWNRPDLLGIARFRGVGTVLVTAASELSRAEGFRGRLGLHSLPRADDFYRKAGMTDLGRDPGYHNLRYFEMTSEQAQAYLGEEDQL